jgi:hypothetical protein
MRLSDLMNANLTESRQKELLYLLSLNGFETNDLTSIYYQGKNVGLKLISKKIY